jgi:hypothetical protein
MDMRRDESHGKPNAYGIVLPCAADIDVADIDDAW